MSRRSGTRSAASKPKSSASERMGRSFNPQRPPDRLERKSDRRGIGATSGGRAGPLNFEFEIAGREATRPATSEEKPADFTVLRNPPTPPGAPHRRWPTCRPDSSVNPGLQALKAGKLDAFGYDRPILKFNVRRGFRDDAEVLAKLFGAIRRNSSRRFFAPRRRP
jgi:hypothetical protein